MKLTPRVALAAVSLLALFGFALRLYRLDAVPLRGDEAFTVQYWAQQPLAESLSTIATIEPHPPLAYALFRAWGLLAGTTEFSMRLLPALFNLIGIPVLYALGCRLKSRRLGLLAAMMWAVNPFQLWHAQDARNYAIWAGLSSGAVWLGLRALTLRRPVDWLLYAGVITLSSLVYYLELFTLAALSAYTLFRYGREHCILRRWLLAQLPALVGTVLAFGVLQGNLLFSGGYGGTTSRLHAPRLVTEFLPHLVFGETLSEGAVSFLWPILLIAIAAGLALLWRRDRWAATFLGLLAVLPLLLLALVSLRLNIFRARYVLAATPAFLLALSSLFLELPRQFKRLGQTIGLGLAAVWLVATTLSLTSYYFDPAHVKSSDWPAVAAYLRQHVAPDDAVIQTSTDSSFGFYYDANADDMALPAFPAQPSDEIERILAQSSRRYRSLWIVGQTFPDWPNVGVVERWLGANMQEVRSTSASGLRIQQYMPWQVRADEIQDLPLASYGDVVELVGATVSIPPEPTNTLTVWLYWRPLARTDTPLKVFVHLIGAVNPATGSPLWAQDDRFPQNGRTNTDSWESPQVYRDVYSLPLASVPPGDYQIFVGFYDPESGQRLPVGDGDSYLVQSVSLTA